MPSPSKPKISFPGAEVMLRAGTADALLFCMPTRISSEFSYGVESVTNTVADWSALMVITTLHPVAPGSGGCEKGVAPEAPGQMDPAQAARVPSASNARLREITLSMRSASRPDRRDIGKTRFIFSNFMCGVLTRSVERADQVSMCAHAMSGRRK